MKKLVKYSKLWFIIQGIIIVLYELLLEYELHPDPDVTPPRFLLLIGLCSSLFAYLCFSKSKTIAIISEIVICLYCIFALLSAYMLICVGSPILSMAILLIVMSVFNLVCGLVILFSLLTHSHDK